MSRLYRTTYQSEGLQTTSEDGLIGSEHDIRRLEYCASEVNCIFQRYTHSCAGLALSNSVPEFYFVQHKEDFSHVTLCVTAILSVSARTFMRIVGGSHSKWWVPIY